LPTLRAAAVSTGFGGVPDQQLLEQVIRPVREELAVLRGPDRAPGPPGEWQGHEFRFDDRAAAHKFDDVPFNLVPADREVRAGEAPRLVYLGVIGYRLIVVKVLSAQRAYD
jgi:hypothetical protein